MIRNNSNFIIIIVLTVVLSISIIFSLTTITIIEPAHANHTENHLNNSLVDVTITGDDIPDALLEDLKRGIIRDMKAEEKKVFEKNNTNISQLKTTTETTKEDNQKGKIILTSHKYTKNDDSDFDDLIGQVKNVGNGTAEDVSIIFTYYDSNGNVIENNSVKTYADILHPGQKSSFYNFRDITKTPDMTYYEIALSWYNSDGSQQYIENVEVTKDPEERIPIIENTDEEKSAIENIPFFDIEGNDIEKEDEGEDEEEDEDDDEDEDDKDNKKKDKDEDDDDDD
jgi:hypothetical protein